jgi:Tfp pilus assembly protein PilN
MRAVNLLPRETRSHGRLRRVDPVLVGGVALTAVVIGAVGAGFTISHSHAASAQTRLATARAELARLQAQHPQSNRPSTPPLSQPTATGLAGSWRLAVDTALGGRIAWDGVLADLARIVPPRVTISNVNLGAGSGTSGTVTGSSLTLGGTAYSQQDIAQLLSRLQLMPGVSQVMLTSSSADSKGRVITFAVSAQVAVAPPATSGGSA